MKITHDVMSVATMAAIGMVQERMIGSSMRTMMMMKRLDHSMGDAEVLDLDVTSVMHDLNGSIEYRHIIRLPISHTQNQNDRSRY